MPKLVASGLTIAEFLYLKTTTTANFKSESTSESSKWVMYALSFTVTSLVAGTVYGWPALRRTLLQADDPLSEERLGVVFTFGSMSVQGGRFAFGLVRDAIGTRRTCCISLAFVVMGALIISTAKSNDALELTFGLFALGLGSGTQICLQPVATLFPASSSAVMSSLSGAFQISGLVYLVLTLGPRQWTFAGFAIIVTIIFVFSYQILPWRVSFAENISGIRPAAARSEGSANGVGKIEQLMSKEYVLLVLWFTTCSCPLQFYIMSIGYQLEQRGDDGTYTSAFVVIYASVAIFAFLGGMLADRCGVGMVQGCATALSGISFTILLLGALEVQVLGMVAYSFGRLLTYAMYFSNIGRRFGYQHYGLLAGFGLLVSAIVASVIQTLLFSLCVSSNEGMVRANVISISILSSAIPYTCWISAREWREKGSAE